MNQKLYSLSVYAGITGSLSGSVIGTITGQLIGTASWANNSISSSFATTAITASYISGGVTFPAGLDITGSLTVTGSQIITGSLNVTRGITGSLFGTSSWANNVISASYALTASYVSGSSGNSVSSSYALTASFANIALTSSFISGTIEFTEGLDVTGSLIVTGSQIITGSLNVTSGITGSLFGTGSWSNNAVSSSFTTTASAATSITFIPTSASFASTASFLNPVVALSASSGLTMNFGGTNPILMKPYSVFGSEYGVDVPLLKVSQGRFDFGISDGKSEMRIDGGNSRFGIYNLTTTRFYFLGWEDNRVYLGGDSTTTIQNSLLYVRNRNSGWNIATFTDNNDIVQATISNIGHISASVFSGSLFGTSSWASNAISSSFATTASAATSITFIPSTASFATTASFALNAGGSGFPYDGTTTPAVISGSLIISGSTTQGLFVTGSTTVLGAFQATTKSFRIDHQRLSGKSLIYGVLEGPEHGVYVRGRIQSQVTGTAVIQLPEDWEWLVDENSITVQLTPIDGPQELYVQNIQDNMITIKSKSAIDCFYLVHATRKDVAPLITVE